MRMTETDLLHPIAARSDETITALLCLYESIGEIIVATGKCPVCGCHIDAEVHDPCSWQEVAYALAADAS